MTTPPKERPAGRSAASRIELETGTVKTTEAAPPPAYRVTIVGVAAAVVLGVAVALLEGAQQLVLYAIGLALGLALFHARFGFTSAFRQLLSVGQGAGFRAHTLMLAAASVLFAPILAGGFGLFGTDPGGFVAPNSLGVVVGAFMFGAGMQLGGACASGTLFASGSGHTPVVITLAAFIAGSVVGAEHWHWWIEQAPSLGAFSLAEGATEEGTWFADTAVAGGFGYGGGLAIQLALLGALAAASLWWTRRRNAPPAGRPPSASGLARVVRGTWPLWVGALALAGLNAATLLVAGRPWGITAAFALWGAKPLHLLGWDFSGTPYWADGPGAGALEASVLADPTSVMNFGIILGALVASAVGGAFVLTRRVPGRTVAAAIVGGLLMGYGARIAFGCNIGAYFSGIASFSLHGWLWAALALAGTYLGLKARPLFGLGNPKPTDGVC